MDIKEMSIDQVEERLSAIEVEKETEGADLKALLDEVRALNERKTELIALAEQRKAELDAIASEKTTTAVVKTFGEERKTMDVKEMRSSDAYAQAFLSGLKKGDYSECRSLISENATNGVVPVPTLLETEIKNAWEECKILSLAKQTSYKGNVKIGFEVSATGAAVHVEGNYNPASAQNPGGVPAEETLVWGSVELKAENIKKWITVSDEALEGTTIDTMGELYKEIAQRIVEAAESIAIGKIVAAGATTSASNPAVPVLTADSIAANTIVLAEGLLSGQAKNLHIAMNRQTYASFIAVAMAANYAIDVFDGLKDKIVFTDALPAFGSADEGETYVIVGDFGYGFQVNRPNGNEISMIVDRYSLAEKDLVKVVGKQFVGMGVVAPKAFVKIAKAEDDSE